VSRRRVLVAAVLLVAAAAGGAAWYRARPGGQVEYRTVKLERGPISTAVSASGTVNAVASTQVGVQIAGQVKDILVDFNTPVKKGQVLARIDPAAFEQRVNQARVDVAAARAEYDRIFAAQAGAPAKVALAALREREALLRQAEADLERTVIRAPVDGTIILRNVEAGQSVAPSREAPVLFAIAQDLRDMRVEAAIGEAEAKRLREGLPAGFTVEAFPRRRFAGEVRSVRRSAARAAGAAYTLLIAAPNPDLALLPGMAATVSITVESRPNALRLPNAALRFRDSAARHDAGRVWTLREGELVPVEVRLGISDGAFTELVGGPLAEGDTVVVATEQPAR